MSEFTQYELPQPTPGEAVVSDATKNSAAAATSSTASQSVQINADVSRFATRLESLEKYVDDIRTNFARQSTDVKFNNVDVRDRLTANFGNVGGWDINSGVLSTPKIQIDSNNQQIKSTNYQPGVSGFKISSDVVEAENIVARGAIKGASFQYDTVSAIGGQLIVANSDTLDQDMTALDSCKITTKGTTTFSANDILLIRSYNGSTIVEEWFRVTSVSGAVLTVTRDLKGDFAADSNPAWKAGTPIVKQGKSDGASTYSGGWLRLFGEGTNSPYYSVFKRTGTAYNTYVEALRIGNLNGFLSYASDEYGIAIGDSSANLTYDPTNGLQLGGTSQSNFYEIVASDTLITSADTEQTINATGYTKVKEILYKEINGTIRVKFDLKSTSPFETYGRIYKNGVAVGTERLTFSTTYATFTEDIAVSNGDLIQIYIKNLNSLGYCSNFRLYYTKTNKIKANTVNLN